MSTQELEQKVRELRQMQAIVEEAQAEVEALKDAIKAAMGQREELRTRRKIIAAEVQSHRDSLLSALSIIHPIDELEGEYIAALGIKLNERLMELKGVDKRIGILSRELGD